MNTIYLGTCYRSFTSDEFFRLFNNSDLHNILFHHALNCAEITGRVYVKLLNTNLNTLNFIIQQQPNDINRNCVLYQYHHNQNDNFSREIANNFSVYQHLVYYTQQDILNMLDRPYDINTLMNEWSNNIIHNEIEVPESG
jgi:hypothetical protein